MRTENEGRTTEATVVGLLVEMDDDALARAWADLNVWKWPRDLPDELKPHWWDGHDLVTTREVQDRKIGVAGLVQAYVSAKVADDVIQKAWDDRTTAAVQAP